MKTRDTHSLSPDAQEALRFRVVQALRAGMKKRAAARTFGVSRTLIDRWLSIVALGNITSVTSKPRGRPKGTRLAPHEAATTVRLITDRCPDQLKLPFALWTREAVQRLLAERFGLRTHPWALCTPRSTDQLSSKVRENRFQVIGDSKSELPPEFIDPNRPGLASVRWAAHCIGTFIARSARQGTIIPILDERRIVRVWLEATKTRVLGVAIEASYDGGRSFEDPLLRYKELTRKDEPPT